MSAHGVASPFVAGISGDGKKGAYSLALSGGACAQARLESVLTHIYLD